MSHSRTRSIFLACGLMLVISGCGAANQSQTASKAAAEPLERITTKGPVKLAVRFSPREPRLSDLAELEVEVTAEPHVDVKPPAFGQAVGDFVVRDYTELTDRQLNKATELNTRRFRYQLEPMHAGRHLVRSLAIEFVDHRPGSEQKDEDAFVESEPFEVNVTSELGDQIPNLANLDPMLPPSN